jgi:hypothetical protein
MGHESERMEMVLIADGAQYRVTCNECGNWLIVPANKQGIADCLGDTIVLSWTSAQIN